MLPVKRLPNRQLPTTLEHLRLSAALAKPRKTRGGNDREGKEREGLQGYEMKVKAPWDGGYLGSRDKLNAMFGLDFKP